MQVRISARQRNIGRSGSNSASPNDENRPPSGKINELLVDTCFATPLKRARVTKGAKGNGEPVAKQPVQRAPLKSSPRNGSNDAFEVVIDAAEEASNAKNAQVGSNALLEARKLFHRSAPARIIGRSQERSTITSFWNETVKQQDSTDPKRILYICGTPGTGKTALLHEMLPGLVTKGLRVVERNCMMFESPSDVLYELACELIGKEKQYITRQLCTSEQQNVCRAIHTSLVKDGRRVVLILDEIDQLLDAHESGKSLLKAVFRWAADVACPLTIIGIANSIDLTARHVPSSLQALAETLYFAPYQVEDIVAILTDRLKRANTSTSAPLIQPLAIELCSRKVAAIGDLRKALEIMQMAFDAAAAEPNAQCVELKHVLAAMNSALTSPSALAPNTGSTSRQLLEPINMNARMVLVALLLFQDENPAPVGTRLPYKKPTLQNIYERYLDLMKLGAGRTGALMEAVSRDDFLLLLTTMETFGITTVVQSGAAAKVGKRKNPNSLQDWQTSLLKLAVTDRPALIDELKQSGLTRLYLP